MTKTTFWIASIACALAFASAAHAQQSSPAKPGSDFPDGPGKDAVVATCGGCHAIDRLKAGYTPQGWRTVMRMMVNFDTPLPPEQLEIVTQYLIKSFPERKRPEAKIIPGPVETAIKQWQVPTAGSRPHDPIATKDGHIWWTGQLSNRLGRLNPKTGAMTEFVLNTAHTGPHGLAEDRRGNIWYTGNHAAHIGKLDPRTGTTTTYPMPDPSVKDPHTIIFDKKGIVWFTAQQGNVIGRLDPKSGQVTLASPSKGSRPYGMAINSKNRLFVVLFGTNKIAEIDANAKTIAIKEHLLPNAASRPRRLAITPDDMVWYSDYPRGKLGRLDPKTGEVKEWESPSGPQSQPYGIVWTKGALWYNESFAKPNTIVRFDPETEKFQSWAIPGGGDIVRNMDVDRDGNPVTANSLTNEVGLVRIK